MTTHNETTQFLSWSNRKLIDFIVLSSITAGSLYYSIEALIFTRFIETVFWTALLALLVLLRGRHLCSMWRHVRVACTDHYRRR